MKKLIELITDEVTKAFVEAGYDEKYAKLHYQTDQISVSISVTEQWQLQRNITAHNL